MHRPRHHLLGSTRVGADSRRLGDAPEQPFSSDDDHYMVKNHLIRSSPSAEVVVVSEVEVIQVRHQLVVDNVLNR